MQSKKGVGKIIFPTFGGCSVSKANAEGGLAPIAEEKSTKDIGLKAIFLDRDGVINRYPGDSDYVKTWNEFHFLPEAKSALKRLTAFGFKIFIISNQAGISKGVYTKRNLNLITHNMLEELRHYNIDISGVYYCIHRDEDNCSCRKPRTGLIDMAVTQLREQARKTNLANSYFIGDTIRDIETGRKAGLKTILVFSGKEKPENKNKWRIPPDFTASNLAEAVDIIINE